jgi:hypothetical protein
VGPTPAVPVAEAVTQYNCASEETGTRASIVHLKRERERERERERSKATNPHCAFQETEHESFKP